jgi:hypothetical protein
MKSVAVVLIVLCLACVTRCDSAFAEEYGDPDDPFERLVSDLALIDAPAPGGGHHLPELASVDRFRSQGESGDALHARHPTGRSASSASVPSRSIISRRLTSAASFTSPAPSRGRNCHAPSPSSWVTSKIGCRPKAIDLVVKTATLGGSPKGQVILSMVETCRRLSRSPDQLPAVKSG